MSDENFKEQPGNFELVDGQQTDFALLAPLALHFQEPTPENMQRFVDLVNCTTLKIEEKFDIIADVKAFENYRKPTCQ